MLYRLTTKNTISGIGFPILAVSGWELLLGILCVSLTLS